MTECGCSEICWLNGWTDQFQPATRELMVFTKSPKRYFDVDAVRQPLADSPGNRYSRTSSNWERGTEQGGRGDKPIPPNQYSAGAPPLDWWQIPSPTPQPVTEYEGEPMTATFYVGDAVTVMNTFPEKSVDLILTSPPFLALRSYLPQDHPDKALEGGSQATPGEYIDWLLDVVEACARVLAPHGSLVFELGDTYSGSGGAGGDYAGDGLREGQPVFKQVGNREHRPEGHPKRGTVAASTRTELVPANSGTGWPLAKSLSLIPETFRWAMVYGHNPHTGRTTPPWRLRNVIRWVRPNPPVGALGDKFRPATSELMVFCKAKDRFFDLDAVREPHKPSPAMYRHGDGQRGGGMDPRYPNAKGPRHNDMPNPSGAPPLDWWNIPPGGYSGAHYAVFPPELLVKPIKAMCPESVCRRCGEASRRIVGEAEYVQPNGTVLPNRSWKSGVESGLGQSSLKHGGDGPSRVAPTLGFSDCGHDDYRPGLVLDPFAGSGTTLAVATGHGRDAIGIDIDSRNFDLALDRVGPLILQRGEIRDGTGPPD